MPTPRDQVLRIIERLSHGLPPETLGRRLAPVPGSARPFPPDVPRSREATEEARRERLTFLRERGEEIPHLAGEAPDPDASTLAGNIEQYIGMTRIPTGIVGPLRVNGLHTHDDFYVPMATTEGALVASYQRGAKLLTLAGGASCLLTHEQVQRAPGFVFDSLEEAVRFSIWAAGEFDAFRAATAAVTRHGELTDLQLQIAGHIVYLVLAYHTGDAAGQNMVTLCTQAVCEDILARTPVAPRVWFVESNMSGDKKATAQSFLNTRGRRVTAEVRLPRALVEEVLKTTPERLCEYWRVGFVGGVQSGSIGVSGHIANGLAALFLATGQDAACVSEASIGVTLMELTAEGGLYVSLDLPNLIVGTVGGGTRLPTASEGLRIMRCEGPGKAAAYAEVAAALLLGGELSIAGALCSGHFSGAHARLGRPLAG